MSKRPLPDRTLLRWLDRDPGRLERHLVEHPEDEERLEALTARPVLAGHLRELLAPPSDLLARMTTAADASGRETTELLVDLLGTAWRTAAVLFIEEERT